MTFDLVGSRSILSILGAHLLLNVKEAGENGVYLGASFGSKSTLSDIVFEAPSASLSPSYDEAAGAETIELEEIC